MSRNTTEQDDLRRETVFRELFRTNFARVARYVERQLGDPTAAEDIAAEVFQIAWQKFDVDDPFGLPWLIGTARHKTRDAQRRHYRKAAAIESMGRLLEDQPEELHHIDRLALNDALARLSEKDLEIVRLTYWDGLSAGEIATVLKIREGAVWTRLHRARARLRSALDESAGSGGER